MGVNEWLFVAKRWYRWFFNLVASRTSMMDPQAPFMLRTTSGQSAESYPAHALRALGLLMADGAPTVRGGKTF